MSGLGFELLPKPRRAVKTLFHVKHDGRKHDGRNVSRETKK
jgi:hypothetical protein